MRKFGVEELYIDGPSGPDSYGTKVSSRGTIGREKGKKQLLAVLGGSQLPPDWNHWSADGVTISTTGTLELINEQSGKPRTLPTYLWYMSSTGQVRGYAGKNGAGGYEASLAVSIKTRIVDKKGTFKRYEHFWNSSERPENGVYGDEWYCKINTYT